MRPMEKAAVITTHQDAVRAELLAILNDDERWGELLTVARGRHVLGSYEHGNANLFEWSDGRVRAERIEELADWIVYSSWLFERQSA